MNPETPQPPRKELEASLTALLLGELPADKAAALREVMEKDLELSTLHERLKLAIELVRETAATPAEQTPAQSPPLKLSDSRRQKLLQHFKTVAPKQFVRQAKRKRTALVEIAAAVAVISVIAALLLPALSKSKSKSRS